jgi:hypothetical protein
MSKIKFAAAHEKIAFGIGADVLAFLVDELCAANRTIVPPILREFPFARGRFRTSHEYSSAGALRMRRFEAIEVVIASRISVFF